MMTGSLGAAVHGTALDLVARTLTLAQTAAESRFAGLAGTIWAPPITLA